MSAPWPTIPLAEAGSWLSGGTPSKADATLWSGTIPWVSPKDMKRPMIADAEDHVSAAAANRGTQLVPPETLLMVVRGMILAHTFPVAITTAPVTFNQDIKALRPRSDIDPWFLLSWLQTVEQEVLRRVEVANHGTKRLPTERLFALRLPLPPLAEQREIAATLKTVAEAITASDAVVKQLERVRCDLAETLLHPASSAGWRSYRLDEMGIAGEPALITGPFGSALKSEHFTREGVPVLTIASLGTGEVRSEGLFYTSTAKARELQAYAVRPGDLVFSRVADVGRSVVIPANGDGWIISSNLMRIRIDGRRLDPRFLMYSITNSRGVLRQLAGMVSNGGRPVVSVPVLRRLRVPCPDVEDQGRIADAIESVENRMRFERLHTTELGRVKSALADVLLSGRLRVRGAA